MTSKPHSTLTTQEAYEAVRESLVDGRDGYEECGICGMELSRGHRMDCAFPNALSSLDSLFEQLEAARGLLERSLVLTIPAYAKKRGSVVQPLHDETKAFLDSFPASRPEVSEGTPASVGSRTHGRGDHTKAVPSETFDPAKGRTLRDEQFEHDYRMGTTPDE